jgi:hypothetical protein
MPGLSRPISSRGSLNQTPAACAWAARETPIVPLLYDVIGRGKMDESRWRESQS